MIFAVKIATAALQDRCGLPADLREEIALQYPNAHVVSLPDLAQDDKKLFQKEHGSDCPGVTKLDFYGDGKPTFAFVLLRGDGARKAELVIAHQIQNQWQTVLLDTADGSMVPVVWGEKPGKYYDVYGQRTVKATRPVVVFCGYESWAILYAWTGKRVEKIWISD